jgi:hypothetical protein
LAAIIVPINDAWKISALFAGLRGAAALNFLVDTFLTKPICRKMT